MQIEVTRNTRAGGQSIAAGKVLTVGKDISKEDAKALIQARKAEEVEGKKAAAKGAKDADK